MTLKSTNIDSCEVSRNIVAELRAARDHGKCFVIAWPRSGQISTGWHGESGVECGCGCGPVK